MTKQFGKEHLEELMECLRFVEDPRVRGRSKHLLIDILVLSVCAILCGAETVLDIEDFGQQKQDWLQKFLKLPAGIPSHDTIARVLAIIDHVQLEIAFSEWVRGILFEHKNIKSMSLDGKSSRGTDRSFNKSTRPLQMVSAYSHELGLTLMQSESQSSGSAELDAALDCLRVLDIKGVTVLADAGLGLKKVLDQIREQKGHYIVPLKNNMSLLMGEVSDQFDKKSGEITGTVDTAHGRKEERYCSVLPVTGMSDRFCQYFEGARTIFVIHRVRSEKDKRFFVQKTGADGKRYYKLNNNEIKTSETTTYYVSTRKLSAENALKEVRSHWKIENGLHWVLDVAFREDSCGVKSKRLARSLTLIRKMALNIIREVMIHFWKQITAQCKHRISDTYPPGFRTRGHESQNKTIITLAPHLLRKGNTSVTRKDCR